MTQLQMFINDNTVANLGWQRRGRMRQIFNCFRGGNFIESIAKCITFNSIID